MRSFRCSHAVAQLIPARRSLSLSSKASSSQKSLNLPKTSFPMHPNPALTEPPLLRRLSREHYKWQVCQHRSNRRLRTCCNVCARCWQATERAAAAPFVLHDGPPYANGDLHMGHFLNKVLKDTINRWMMLKGRRVHYRPGWDCHGLPIEIRALQLAAASAGDGAAPRLAEEPLQLREAAAACAHEAMAGQLASFERWGVMGAWDAPYTTMQPAYEAAELGVLRALLQRGEAARRRAWPWPGLSGQ